MSAIHTNQQTFGLWLGSPLALLMYQRLLGSKSGTAYLLFYRCLDDFNSIIRVFFGFTVNRNGVNVV